MMIQRISLAIALAAASVGASAQFVFGVNRNAEGGGLYSINMLTGASTLVGPTLGSGQLNGLAYDAANNALYYGSDADNRKLRRYDINAATTTTFTGTIAASSASGAFYRGSYYYIAEGTRNLRMVSFSGSAIASDTVVVTGAGAGWGFGDIAITPTGIVYGSTTNNSFWTADLNNPAGSYTILSTNHGDRLQLGFSGGVLYGVSTDDDKLFSVNVANGARTFLSTMTNRNLFITDAADAPVPEPATLAALGVGLIAMLKRRKRA